MMTKMWQIEPCRGIPMKRALLLGAMLAVAFVSAPVTQDASAGDYKSRRYSDDAAKHPRSSYYRTPQVRGYTARRGGYSYTYADTIDTYGNPRTQYGGSNLYRDPMLDKQTNAGPFDHGFFFDSAITPRGGDSPYMN
jgi:hypothetical protein